MLATSTKFLLKEDLPTFAKICIYKHQIIYIMKIFLSIFLFFTSLAVFSQNDSAYFSTEMNVQITAIDYIGSRNKLMDFISTNQITIQNQDEERKSITAELKVSKAIYDQFEKIVASIGYITTKRVNTTNNSTKVQDIKLEIRYLKSKKEAYNELLKKVDEKTDKYIMLWNENMKIEENIFENEKELLQYQQKENNYFINVTVSEESTTPESTKVRFVNMPGFEYSFLQISAPKVGLTDKSYQGYFVKYLVTKGKTYAMAGAYKATNTKTIDSTTFSELFMIAFGQDFYSRHLGRGTRKFLNLYSGYTVGYMFATGDISKSNIFNFSPSVGIELFKNKYFLLDTKASYFIPLKYNKELRGLSVSASLNFVF